MAEDWTTALRARLDAFTVERVKVSMGHGDTAKYWQTYNRLLQAYLLVVDPAYKYNWQKPWTPTWSDLANSDYAPQELIRLVSKTLMSTASGAPRRREQ
jgi:hypothetical protein